MGSGETLLNMASKGVTLHGKVTPYQANQGCIRHELKLSGGKDPQLVCSIHAEINAIAKAARKGIKIDGSVMFITSFPCLICMRAIIASGIKKIIYMNDFYKLQPFFWIFWMEFKLKISEYF